MTLSPTSSRGGAGAVAPLTLTAPNDASPVLKLVAAAGTITDGNSIFIIQDELGATQLIVDPDFVQYQASTGAGPATLSVDQRDAGGGGVAIKSDAGIDLNGGSVRIRNAGDNNNGLGFLAEGPHAAPADGAIAPGYFTLWLDQTDGVGNTKLMVKAKSANGTVKTAAIVLA